MLNQIRQRRRRIGHGVGAVGDHKTVVVVVVFLDGGGHEQPLFRLDVGAVDVEQLHRVDGTEVLGLRNTFVQLPGGDAGGQTVLRGGGGDGSAGGDKKNALQGRLLLSCKWESFFIIPNSPWFVKKKLDRPH